MVRKRKIHSLLGLLAPGQDVLPDRRRQRPVGQHLEQPAFEQALRRNVTRSARHEELAELPHAGLPGPAKLVIERTNFLDAADAPDVSIIDRSSEALLVGYRRQIEECAGHRRHRKAVSPCDMRRPEVGRLVHPPEPAPSLVIAVRDGEGHRSGREQEQSVEGRCRFVRDHRGRPDIEMGKPQRAAPGPGQAR
ncbi:MAG: hypothetical protein CYG61_09255 [Actinobacteria bacterium]|nr:MAG: hypothetical protein CYG61_09255 [Actinomycetota bacterium]